MNKQIDEMATIALKNTMSYTCAKQIAMNIYEAGYRKQEEVAREIIAEIESIHEEGRSMIAWMENFFKKIAKLKQKYGVTEE